MLVCDVRDLEVALRSVGTLAVLLGDQQRTLRFRMRDHERVGLIELALHPPRMCTGDLGDGAELTVSGGTHEPREVPCPLAEVIAAAVDLSVDGFANAAVATGGRGLDALPDAGEDVAGVQPLQVNAGCLNPGCTSLGTAGSVVLAEELLDHRDARIQEIACVQYVDPSVLERLGDRTDVSAAEVPVAEPPRRHEA